MASAPGKWEVAGKDGKARKITAGNKAKKTKVNEADLPKLDIKAPIPESKTQFDAFSTNEPETFAIPKQESDTDAGDQISSRNDVNRKIERKHKHHKEPQHTFDVIFNEALKKCDSSSVEIFISESKDKYPNNEFVLLKDLTGFLQEKFIKMPVEKDPVLGNQTSDFPLSCLANDVQDHIIDELKHCNEDEIEKFFSYCLDELLIEINKGHATYGIRVMIQCVLKCDPRVTMKNRKEYLQRVISRKVNPREALSLLWAFGQTSDHENLEERMTVWSSFFLPVIESKQLSKYVLDYLETTLSLKLPDKFTGTPISGRKFQHIVEITYGSNFVHFPYRRQLQLLYPEIKAIVFTARSPKSPLTGVFSQLFDSLNTDSGKEYVQEALNCLLECLEKDAKCHHEWRNNYLARMKESSLLLKAIVEQWDSICRSVPRKYLVETLREFENVNNELKEREKPKAVLLSCEASCKALLDVISNTPVYIPPSPGPSRITRIFKIILFALLMFVCVDMYKHSGYQGSKTSKVLKQYGVENGLVNTYNHVYNYAERLESWIEKHYPYYYKKVRDVVEPASDYTVTKLGEGLHYIANVTAPARQYIHKNVPPLLEKFEGFVSYCFNRIAKTLLTLWDTYYPIVKQYLQRAWDTLAIWVPFAWARAQELTLKTASWVYNLSPDFFDAIYDGFRRLVTEVVTRTPHILTLVQEYLSTAWKLIMENLLGVVSWLKKNVIYARAYGDE